MKRSFLLLLTILCLTITGARGQAEFRALPDRPVITVNGQGQIRVPPDQVVIRMGAVSQARQASVAQTQVNAIVERTVQELVRLGIPERAIRTAGISLMPVYSHALPSREAERRPPEIVAYRASNVVQITLNEIQRTGEVLDAGVAAGANQIESIAFSIRDDLRAREEALVRALDVAREKARRMAAAMGVELGNAHEIIETDPGIVRPFHMERAMMHADAATPVQPGEISVEASVTVRFLIREIR